MPKASVASGPILMDCLGEWTGHETADALQGEEVCVLITSSPLVKPLMPRMAIAMDLGRSIWDTILDTCTLGNGGGVAPRMHASSTRKAVSPTRPVRFVKP